MVLAPSGTCRHCQFWELPELLHADDLLVVNDTKVIPARLFARRQPGGGRVELLLAEKTATKEWIVLARPGRQARVGNTLEIAPQLDAQILAKEKGGKYRIRFSQPIEAHLDRIGHTPLPPYIKRPDREDDRTAYQTVYARVEGAIAAPTAGLHFSTDLLEELRGSGVGIASLTLHVGIGTFKPVSSALVHEHQMDSERFHLPEETAAAVARTRLRGGRLVAVGTTVVRTLEAAAREDGGPVEAGSGSTDLFITPGFDFKVVDLLLTNFHLPRSTLLMLVCAFAGRERILAAYREAIETEYRFYSYGDALLVARRKG